MKFNSPKLQECFDSVKPILDKIPEIQNSISSDIQELEKYLKSIDINETISYLASDPAQTCNVICEYFSSATGTGKGIAIEEVLVWDHIKKRLMYVKDEYEADVDIDDEPMSVKLNVSTAKNITNKPLIETSFDIRKKMHEHHLNSFLSVIANKFKINSTHSLEDIPF